MTYIDRESALKHPIAPVPFDVERGRLRFFARTIGLTDPVYFDVEAARGPGHRDLPAPPRESFRRWWSARNRDRP